MNTLEFLRTVLPSSGAYVVASPRESPEQRIVFDHFRCSSLEEMRDKIVQLDKTRTVFHACASFKTTNNNERFSRSQKNTAYCRSFWLDLDCGEDKAKEGKGYINQREAVKSLLVFIKKTNLPMPLVINSGYGVHAYWILEKDIPSTEWKQTAELLKRLFKEAGVITDPSRTADSASILRPVGSHNKKHGDSREVTWMGVPYRVVSHEAFRSMVSDCLALLTGETFDLGSVPAYLQGVSAADSINIFSQSYEYDADKIADKCKVLGHFRKTQGDLSYNAWRGAIGVLTFCKDGRDIAFKWSERRAETGHSNVDVATRFDTWDSAPTRCDTFRAECPELCKDCPNQKDTPLYFGREFVKPEETKPEELPKDKLPELPLKEEIHPEGYFWDSGTEMMNVITRDKDGVETPIPFTPYRFYLTGRVREVDGSHICTAVLYDPFGRPKEFVVSCKAIAVGSTALMQELGRNEITPAALKGSEAYMTGYLRNSMNKLRHTVDLTRSFTSFGWQDNSTSFLLGDKLYKPGEVDTKVVLRGHALSKAALFKSSNGDPTVYAEALNSVYAREGMEPMQYAIASLWGAPLASLVEDALYKGIPCALTGTTSGKGKTTAFTAALYAFGNAEKMTIKGEQGATPNARTAFLGAMQSLPILIDEITNIKSTELSNLAYVVSNGGDRNRLQVNKNEGAVGFADTASWCTQIGLTGNSCLIDRLAQNGSSDAEAMRIFEIRVDNYDIPKLDPLMVSSELSKMEENAGVVGPIFIQYVVNNLTHVRAMMAETLKQVMDDKFLAVEPKYRFYRWHIVTTLTAAKIMADLGVCKFDIKKLTAFAKEAVVSLCTTAGEKHSLSAPEILFSFIQDISDQTITTRRMEDIPQDELDRIHAKKYVARAIRGDKNVNDEYDGSFIVQRVELSRWCLANRYDIKKLESDLKEIGVLREKNRRFNLSRGIPKLPKVQLRTNWFMIDKLIEVQNE